MGMKIETASGNRLSINEAVSLTGIGHDQFLDYLKDTGQEIPTMHASRLHTGFPYINVDCENVISLGHFFAHRQAKAVEAVRAAAEQNGRKARLTVEHVAEQLGVGTHDVIACHTDMSWAFDNHVSERTMMLAPWDRSLVSETTIERYFVRPDAVAAIAKRLIQRVAAGRHGRTEVAIPDDTMFSLNHEGRIHRLTMAQGRRMGLRSMTRNVQGGLAIRLRGETNVEIQTIVVQNEDMAKCRILPSFMYLTDEQAGVVRFVKEMDPATVTVTWKRKVNQMPKWSARGPMTEPTEAEIAAATPELPSPSIALRMASATLDLTLEPVNGVQPARGSNILHRDRIKYEFQIDGVRRSNMLYRTFWDNGAVTQSTDVNDRV